MNLYFFSKIFIFTGIKYKIKPLEVRCIDFILNLLSQEHDNPEMFAIFQFCVDYEVDKRVMKKCMSMMTDYVQLLSDSQDIWEAFCKISHRSVMTLLKCNCIDVDELCLFEAVCFYLFLFDFLFQIELQMIMKNKNIIFLNKRCHAYSSILHLNMYFIYIM